MQRCIVGVDVGGTNIRFGAVTPTMELLHEKKMPSRGVRGPQAGETLLGIVKEYLAGLTDVEVTAVSMGFPSTLNRDRSVVLNSPNIPGLDNVSITAYSRSLGLPVYAEHDACMLMYYDIYFNHIPTAGLGVAYYIGTGLGNAILIDGRPLVGKNGVAGEVGHIHVLGRNDPCGCGLNGCMELYAGGRGFKDIRDQYYPGEDLDDLFGKYGLSEPLEQYLGYAAAAVAAEVTILDPDYLVLGGGVLSTRDFPTEHFVQKIKDLSRHPYPAENLQVYISRQENAFNGVLGAAHYAYSLKF